MVTLHSSAECGSVLRNLGNIDRFIFDHFDREGMTLRLFDLETKQWSIHWAERPAADSIRRSTAR